MLRYAARACAVVAGLGVSPYASAGPLLINGSLTGTPGPNSVPPGWSIANATPDTVDANGPFNNTGVPWTLSPDGGTFVRCNGTGNEINLEAFRQTVSGFAVGEAYRLDFYQTNLGFKVVGGEWRNHPGFWGLIVDGAMVGQSSVIGGPANPTDPIQWSAESISFVATDTTLTLRLEAFSTADSPADESEFGYMGIDGLQLTLVTCPWDCGDGDDNVGIVDFLALLAQWGGPGSCDFDGGGVGITDFLELLANWGPCP